MAGEDTIISGMAGRYASALFDLALQNEAVDSVAADLDRFDALIMNSPDLARLVRSPVFAADDQTRALSAVLDRVGLTGIAANFLKVAAANRRLYAIRDMIRHYRALVAKHRGEASAQVIVAEALSETHLAGITDVLKSVTGKDVKIDVRIEPSIIGGLIVKLGSRMVDASLRAKLNSIRHAMKEVG